MTEQFGQGLLFSPPSPCDAIYGAFEDTAGATPAEWSLPAIGGIRNQLQNPSCVAQSIARIMDYANHYEGDPRKTSARYGFAYCKLMDGMPTLFGTFFTTGLDIAIKQGFAQVESWADTSDLAYPEYIKVPTKPADISAEPFKVQGYVRFNTEQEIKDYLMKYKLPVLIGINSNNTGWGRTVVKNNGYVLKEPTGTRLGHAVACVGWNETGWVFENSWGASWGDQGRATVPYNYSGLQASYFGVYDLPNGWKEINTNYNNSMNYLETNAIVFSLYRKFLGREPKPEEMTAIKAHVEKILHGLSVGGDKGQEIVDAVFAGFVPEVREAVNTGKI
jgi:hypothetical protein